MDLIYTHIEEDSDSSLSCVPTPPNPCEEVITGTEVKSSPLVDLGQRLDCQIDPRSMLNDLSAPDEIKTSNLPPLLPPTLNGLPLEINDNGECLASIVAPMKCAVDCATSSLVDTDGVVSTFVASQSIKLDSGSYKNGAAMTNEARPELWTHINWRRVRHICLGVAVSTWLAVAVVCVALLMNSSRRCRQPDAPLASAGKTDDSQWHRRAVFRQLTDAAADFQHSELSDTNAVIYPARANSTCGLPAENSWDELSRMLARLDEAGVKTVFTLDVSFLWRHEAAAGVHPDGGQSQQLCLATLQFWLTRGLAAVLVDSPVMLDHASITPVVLNDFIRNVGVIVNKADRSVVLMLSAILADHIVTSSHTLSDSSSTLSAVDQIVCDLVVTQLSTAQLVVSRVNQHLHWLTFSSDLGEKRINWRLLDPDDDDGEQTQLLMSALLLVSPLPGSLTLPASLKMTADSSLYGHRRNKSQIIAPAVSGRLSTVVSHIILLHNALQYSALSQSPLIQVYVGGEQRGELVYVRRTDRVHNSPCWLAVYNPSHVTANLLNFSSAAMADCGATVSIHSSWPSSLQLHTAAGSSLLQLPPLAAALVKLSA